MDLFDALTEIEGKVDRLAARAQRLIAEEMDLHPQEVQAFTKSMITLFGSKLAISLDQAGQHDSRVELVLIAHKTGDRANMTDFERLHKIQQIITTLRMNVADITGR